MSTIISSQQYLDDATVAAKLATQDFTVSLSPVFMIEGAAYQVVIDGHHSLAAAREADVAPQWHEATIQECDSIALLARGEIEDFLTMHWIDSDWYDITTGTSIW